MALPIYHLSNKRYFMTISLTTLPGSIYIYNAYAYPNKIKNLSPMKVTQDFSILPDASSTILKNSTVYIRNT